MSIEKAELSDGRVVEYVVVPDPPSGGMKSTYFAPDRSYVVQFYHDIELSKDPLRRNRLERVIGAFNPTLDGKVACEYWRKRFCWPTGIVVKPRLGIVCPTYRPNFFFSEGQHRGLEKQGTWFVLQKPRSTLSEKDRGPWVNYLQICIQIARAARCLHAAGLAHSDLSVKNILVDPSSGESAVIDIDSLVVPNIFPPDVIGTPGYIAPEVIATLKLPMDKRKHPDIRTDTHALAVLIYQYLLLRHPLIGPKNHSTASTEENDELAMGRNALFIENPHDQSNRPTNLAPSYEILGPLLSKLIYRAFVEGLHDPPKRPDAGEWEKMLCWTWDLKVDCQNSACPNKWFIFTKPKNPVCPYCGTRRRGTTPVLKLRRQARTGHWVDVREVVIHHHQQMFEWHTLDNKFPGETADRTRLAYCAFHEGQWLLINEKLTTLTSPSGNRVGPKQAIALSHGAVFRFSEDPHGYQAEVHVVNCN